MYFYTLSVCVHVYCMGKPSLDTCQMNMMVDKQLVPFTIIHVGKNILRKCICVLVQYVYSILGPFLHCKNKHVFL